MPRANQRKRKSPEVKAKDVARETSTSSATTTTVDEVATTTTVDEVTERDVAEVDTMPMASVVAEVEEVAAAATTPKQTQMASRSQARSPATEATEAATAEEAVAGEVVVIAPRVTNRLLLLLVTANVVAEDPRLPNLAPRKPK